MGRSASTNRCHHALTNNANTKTQEINFISLVYLLQPICFSRVTHKLD